MHYLLIILAGFAGSFHCIGMCGGFACGLGVNSRSVSRVTELFRHLCYNTGRVVTYIFIGGLAGVLGDKIITGISAHGPGKEIGANESVMAAQGGHSMHQLVLAGQFGLVQMMLSVIAGFLMLAMAMQLLGVWHHRPRSWLASGAERLASPIRLLMASQHPGGPLALGVINGFLPCPLVYAFAVMAAATATAAGGMLTMAAFGLGTFPALLFAGWLGKSANLKIRRYGVRLAAAFVIVFGLMTMLRGLLPTVLQFSS